MGHLLGQHSAYLDAVHSGHLHVEQGHVNRLDSSRSKHLITASDLRDDLQIGLETEKCSQGAAHQRLVIGQQQSDHNWTFSAVP